SRTPDVLIAQDIATDGGCFSPRIDTDFPGSSQGTAGVVWNHEWTRLNEGRSGFPARVLPAATGLPAD
ncbi:MAG: hypothetical protein ACK5MO_13645, partial [Planctomyces sp.]